ncbi:single-stranded-DNA-specific exonuclease RecJ [Butyricicoccus pullicaecorum]|uniref:Single-stranded-DNA-specific exonuclease RecJ n=3 Tax=Butyricicoccus pullicaecorum TaxID=501571 RepID=R8VXM7_9FIRM|nr:single-stranded-DNA-specific exonuclease RecJ [Butyricicoccus pullicaecorum]EOQ37323.1 single-stranded-DNA-specific exonuclease RecJ [Butyricicoccus pullicaecorum 1.2]SKA59022.1 single-stranded-DNA-specific exonuclease [Butyricicoccus pullicaecorum DSM 23266]
MKMKRWVTAKPNLETVRSLARSCGFTPLAAAALCARGIDTPEAARAFLETDPAKLHDPMLLPDMAKARDTIRRAIEQGKKIAVFGDYDVDGVTSTCVMTRVLRSLGADVRHYIPDRLSEGYGLSMGAMDRLAQDGIGLIVTVDSGVSAFEEIARARELGMEVVVTDHHECREELPDANAVVNPKRADSTYPFAELAGVGVAFKLACALAGDGQQRAVLEQYADLVALGTVADVMLLVGENRIIVAAGLRRMAETQNVGLSMLLHESGQQGKRLTASTISFILAPRINAAGRLGHADMAAELFLTDDPRRAQTLAMALCEQNKQRQATENQILEQALQKLRLEYDPLEDQVIVLAGEDWHHGVIGIVSSRICDRYACPTVLIALEDGIGKGSGRSVKGFNLYEALCDSAPLLERFGGHELAAGLTIREENIQQFHENMEAWAREHVNPQELMPILHIDCPIAPEFISTEATRGLDVLEPFGMGNPQPVFSMCDLLVEEITPISSDRHVRLTLSKDGQTYTAMLFGTGQGGCGFAQGNYVDAAFCLEINEYRGRCSVQLVIRDIQLSTCEVMADQKILNLYNRFMSDGALTAREARVLLPERRDLVAVWRHILSRSEDGWLSVPDGALSRRVSWESRREINIGKLLVCLDVFSESRLLSYHFREGQLNIVLKHIEGKADISKSVVLKTLQSMSKDCNTMQGSVI